MIEIYKDGKDTTVESAIRDMHRWLESMLPYADELLHIQVYAESFLFEPTIADDVWLMEDFYFPEDYLTESALEVLSQYNKEFKCMLLTSIDTTLPWVAVKQVWYTVVI